MSKAREEAEKKRKEERQRLNEERMASLQDPKLDQLRDEIISNVNDSVEKVCCLEYNEHISNQIGPCCCRSTQGATEQIASIALR